MICWTLFTICLANCITAKQLPEHDQEATALILLHNKIFFCFEVLHKKTKPLLFTYVTGLLKPQPNAAGWY